MIKKARKWIIRISVALTAVFCVCGAAACGAPQQLDMPENLQLDGRMLTWDEVQGADGYAVYVDDQEYMVEDNAFEIPFLAGPKTYQVEVMALGDWKKTKDSVCGEIEYTKVLAEAEGEKDGFHFVLMDDLESYEIVACDNKEGYVEFPDVYLDYPVKKIGKALFGPGKESWYQGNPVTGENCNKITTGIKLPRYLEEIDDYAFGYCLYLEEVVMPDSVKRIGSSAFACCYQLGEIDFPSSLREIGTGGFAQSLLEMREMIFPDGIESIGGNAIGGGTIGGGISEDIPLETKLERVVIPNSIKSIGSNAFRFRTNLKEIEIQTENIEEFGERVFEYTAWYEAQPEGFVYLDKILYKYKGDLPENYKLTIDADVLGIAPWAFSNQKNLTEAWIADGVKFFGVGIFGETGLKTVRLPADLTWIPDYTFGQAHIREIEIPATVTEIGERALECGSFVFGKVFLHAKCKMTYETFGGYNAVIVWEGEEYRWWTGGKRCEGTKYCHIDDQGYFTILE